MPTDDTRMDDFEDLDPTESDDDLDLALEEEQDDGDESGDEATDHDEPEDLDEEEEPDKGKKPRAKEDDGEDGKFGKRAKKRIDKLVYERNTARQENAELRAQLVAQKAAESSQVKIGELETKRDELKTRRRAAFDEGDLDTMDKLDDELADVAFELNLAKHTKQAAVPTARTPQGKQQTTSIPKATQDWLANNQWFYQDQARAAKAREVEKQLISEGFDSADPDLWAELDKRLTKAPAKRSTVSGPTRGHEGTEGGTRGRISRDDYAAARMVGLDLSKPADRKTWLARDEEL